MVRAECWLPWARVVQERRTRFLGVLGILEWYLLLFVLSSQKMKGMKLSWDGKFLSSFLSNLSSYFGLLEKSKLLH